MSATIALLVARQAPCQKVKRQKLTRDAGFDSNNKCATICMYSPQNSAHKTCDKTIKIKCDRLCRDHKSVCAALCVQPKETGMPKQGGTLKISKKRGVSFHSSAKTWDGVCTATQNLQHLVWEFWHKGSGLRMLDEFITQRRYNELCALCEDLRQTIERVKQLGMHKRTPLNPKGGGKSIMIGIMHLPNITRLYMMTKFARDQCQPKPKPRLNTNLLQSILDDIVDIEIIEDFEFVEEY